MVQSGGTQQPLVMIHDFTDNGACLHPIANALADQITAITYDVRGHGLSDARPENYSIESLVEDCIAFCDSICETPPVLYGHSLGAEIGLRAAREQKTAGLVLESPPAATRNQPTPSKQKEIKQLLQQLEDWRTQSHDSIQREYARDDPRFSDALATARKQLRPEIVNIYDWEYTPLDSLIGDTQEIPTLVLRADDDIVPYDVPDDRQAVKHDSVERLTIENASHTILRDEYATATAEIRHFIQEEIL